MKRTEPKSFASIFDEAMARAGATDTLAQQRACFLWSEVVGPGVNRYTYRRYVDAGVLHVYISSASLRHELSFYREQLIRRLNDAVGSEALTDIQFH
ncbi:MAG: DUF721 domain-containing protein [Bacteroides sp.]|nr:DUF721 domain-containing protein [Bacteroides sp.]MCM1413987.1 DUF721 domain-containing protein [Bacteroides sp.]MCM1471796.1 DUF721 domain-containing protein [Bacteroides sp.]